MAGMADFERDPSKSELPGEGWAVVLFDDNIHEVKHAACLLKRVAGISIEQAIDATIRAGENGQAIVTITSEARANEIIAQLLAAEMHAELRLC